MNEEPPVRFVDFRQVVIPTRVRKRETKAILRVRVVGDADYWNKFVANSVEILNAAEELNLLFIVDRKSEFRASAEIDRLAVDLFEDLRDSD